jgi:2-alkenal reductase
MRKISQPITRAIAGALLTGAVIGFGLGGAAVPAYSVNASANTLTVNSALVQAATPSADPQTDILEAIYAKVNPSVVSITVRLPASATTNANPTIPQRPNRNPNNTNPAPQAYQYAAGSGWVYDGSGHIVTNAHVVEGADQITITFSDGNQFRATVVGIDPDSDLAVIKATGDISKYPPLTLADSDKVQVGERAIAIGNPFEQSGTMTHGIVSAVGRSVSGSAANYVIPNAIQTDAAINPGNSGGPLLNAAGEVIGVNQQIAAEVRQSSGVSFAIPANLVKKVATALIANGSIAHSYLGISGGTVNIDLVEALKLPANTHGAYVGTVVAGGPAAKAGVVASAQTTNANVPVGGDIITAVDGQAVRSFDDLTGYLYMKTEPGQTITLSILRDGKQLELKVTLAARPKAQTNN